MYKYLKYIWKPRGWEPLWKKSATYIPRFKRETDFRLGGEQNLRGVAWKIEERHSASNSSATTLSLGQGRGNWLIPVFVMKRIRTALDNCAHRPFQPRSKRIFSLKISSVWIYARVQKKRTRNSIFTKSELSWNQFNRSLHNFQLFCHF